MAHLIAITFIWLSWKDILTSPMLGEKLLMAIVSKSERNDRESLCSYFFWAEIKEIITSHNFLWKNASSTYQTT